MQKNKRRLVGTLACNSNIRVALSGLFILFIAAGNESGQSIQSLATTLAFTGNAYYVSQSDGDDNNTGTQSQPWETLTYASTQISDGDALYLRRGDSWTGLAEGGDENGLIYINNKNDITLDAYGIGAKPVIDRTSETDPSPDGLHPDYTCIEIVGSSSNVTVSNLDLRGGVDTSAVYVDAGTTNNILNCDVQGSGWYTECLAVVSSTTIFENCFFDQITGNPSGYSASIEFRYRDGSIVRNCTFKGYGFGGAVRYSNEADNGVIEGNFFYHPDTRRDWCWAIVVRSQGGGTVILRNNVIDLHGGGGRGMAFWYDYVPTTRKIFNNVFISNGTGTGIVGCGSVNSEVLLYNNIFYDLAVGFDNPDGNVIARNNLFYSVANRVDGSFDEEYDTITTDPNLVNHPMSSNLATDARIQFPSDAIDGGYGSDPDTPVFDYEGTPRPQGSIIDIGAFEYGGPDTTVPTRSKPQPNGTLSPGTTSTNISLSTNVQAICRYSNNSGTNYTNMTGSFTYTNSTNHSTPVIGLENGKTYVYYVRCNSTEGYVNVDDFNISFSIDGHKADINDDGVINMHELIAFIARWKACDGVTRAEVEEARDIWFAGGGYGG